MDLSYPLFNESEYQNRRSKLEEKLSDIDYSVIFARPDLFYYSGTGLDGIITYGDEFTRYVRRNIELGKEEANIETKLMSSFRLFKELGKNNTVDTLGLELDLLPYRTVKYIRKAFEGPELIDIGSILREIRSVKSEDEINLMKLAAEQTDDSFEHIQDMIEPGKTELELSAEIEHFLRNNGHPGWVQVRMFHHNLTSLAYVMAGESTATLNTSFGPVSGQGLCKMHKNGPSHRKIRDNEAVLIDTTGVIEGYTGDETRTFFVGNPDDKLIDAYEVAKAVQMKIKELLIPGNTPSEVYNKINTLVDEFGYLDNFMGKKDDKVPFIGHGVGLELDEFPIITDKFEGELKEGNIVAVEPKFIFDKPKSGVGIEDTWVVRPSSAEKLTQFHW